MEGVIGKIFAVAQESGSDRPKAGRRKAKKAPGKGRSGAGFRTAKEQGEWAELCFMARARGMRFTVLKPYGDSASYDVGIDCKGKLVRVQVKSTTFLRGNTYTCNLVGPGHKMYPPGVLDYFAVYLVTPNLWYILLFHATRNSKGGSVQFTVDNPGHKYHEYLEAWHLLKEK